MTEFEAFEQLADYGRAWRRQQLPSGFDMQAAGECFANAQRLVSEERGTYVEGDCRGTHHAWVVDDTGGVIETSPGNGGYIHEYTGVPLVGTFVVREWIKAGHFAPLLPTAAQAIRDGTAVAEVIDLDLLARFDAIKRASR